MLCGVLFGSVFFNDISPIGNKTTIPLQIIEAGLFIIQCGLLKRESKKRISSFSTQHLAFFRAPSSCECP